jgi:hypothetical protein
MKPWPTFGVPHSSMFLNTATLFCPSCFVRDHMILLFFPFCYVLSVMCLVSCICVLSLLFCPYWPAHAAPVLAVLSLLYSNIEVLSWFHNKPLLTECVIIS